MFSLKKLSMTCGAIVVLAGLSIPASAEEFADNKGPVEFHEPIVAELGDKRVIAYYEADSGQCGLNVVVWNGNDVPNTPNKSGPMQALV
jgi:hypothetical protein